MSMIITHNISAINTRRNLSISNRNLSKSLEKLSSGYRINVGADGPADLIISEQLRAQNAGLERAVRNTQEASNVLGIAEGALNEMNAILKKMRALALHAANNGITSPEQVAADQSEVDSGIQTIDRIANTTKYSDQFLLNGGKGIVFDATTITHSTQQNSLINTGMSNLDQIFKRSGFNINLAFTGTTNPNATTAVGDADVSREARKAYFEIDSNNGKADIDANGALTKTSEFIVTGNKGSRLFKFDIGASMGQIASAINNVADSTGVDASLIFASDQTNDAATNLGGAIAQNIGGSGTMRSAGQFAVFNNYNDTGSAVITAIGTAAGNIVIGENTDGLGRIFVKITGDASYELYKDESLSEESKIGHGTEGNAVIEDNDSNISSLVITTIANNNAGHVAVIGVDGIEGTNGVSYSGAFTTTTTATNAFSEASVFYNGVQLGKNTDAEGKIYFKTVMSAATTGQVFAYRDSRMASEDLVAQSEAGIALGADSTVMLSEVKNAEQTAGSGLGIALGVDAGFSASAGDTFNGEITFTNLGVRIASREYGSDQFVRLQQFSGSIWQYYDQADSSSETMVDAGTNTVTVQQNGQDATLSVNGMKVTTNGLDLNLSTQDVQARLTFNEGRVGSTTIAQVGYTEGTVYSRAELLTNTSDADFHGAGSNTLTNLGAVLTNAGHVTLEQLDHFMNGMQFQLGEGAGDQERTVYSVESMDVANLGVTSFTGQFDPTKAVIETRQLSLQDVLGGGLASLAVDPVKALSIIDQAISDVSNLRARLGATQANLLQTNANSLQVAIENIQKTESAIRDTDMAAETTQFTKNQIMVSAGTSMLAQANVVSQSVLQLLG